MAQPPAPPDVGLGHDALQPVAEVEEGVDLETHRVRPKQGTRLKLCAQRALRCAAKKNRAAAPYPGEAVKSVGGREVKVQAQEVEGQDAEQVHLKESGEFSAGHSRSRLKSSAVWKKNGQELKVRLKYLR